MTICTKRNSDATQYAPRKRAMLLHFGTAGKVRAASREDLQRAPGVSAAVAQTVYDFYHPGG